MYKITNMYRQKQLRFERRNPLHGIFISRDKTNYDPDYDKQNYPNVHKNDWLKCINN